MSKKMKKMPKSRLSMSGMPSVSYRSMAVEPAENGYIISYYTGEGKDKKVLAKDEEEAKSIVMKMMGMHE